MDMFFANAKVQSPEITYIRLCVSKIPQILENSLHYRTSSPLRPREYKAKKSYFRTADMRSRSSVFIDERSKISYTFVRSQLIFLASHDGDLSCRMSSSRIS